MSTGISGLLINFAGFICGWLFIFCIPLDLTAIVTGAIALRQIRNKGGAGKPQALTGIICGALALILFAVGIVVIIVFTW